MDKKKHLARRKYQPAISIKKMSEEVGLAESTIRKYIKESKIDRRGDNARIKLDIVRRYKRVHNYPKPSAAIARELGMSYNTLKKYWDMKPTTQIKTAEGKISSYKKNTLVKSINSVGYTDKDILDRIQQLYIQGHFDCDLTYGRGNFYRDCPTLEPPEGYRFDKYPEHCPIYKKVQPLTPYLRGHTYYKPTFRSIVADPPHYLIQAGYRRDGNYDVIAAYQDLVYIHCDILEFAINRLLPGGYLVLTASDANYREDEWINFLVQRVAKAKGFHTRDIFIRIYDMPEIMAPINSKLTRSQTAHSYFFVFQKR